MEFTLYFCLCDSCGPLPALNAQKKLFVLQHRKVLNPLEIPNIFTPNGDGKNDQWFVPNLESSCNQTYHKTMVLDRWGVKVFETTDPYFSWEANGLPDGIYFYLIDMEPKQLKGLLQVQR